MNIRVFRIYCLEKYEENEYTSITVYYSDYIIICLIDGCAIIQQQSVLLNYTLWLL